MEAMVSNPPLSNLQLELLRLYTHKVSDADLLEIKKLLANYFANRLTKLADEAWDKNGWTEADMYRILNEEN